MEVLKLDSPLVTREPSVLLDPQLAPGIYIATVLARSARGNSAPASVRIVVLKRVDPGVPFSPGPGRGVIGSQIAKPDPPAPATTDPAEAKARAGPAVLAKRPRAARTKPGSRAKGAGGEKVGRGRTPSGAKPRRRGKP